MLKFDTIFLLLGGISLVAGVSLGIYMGIVHDFQLAPVHAHINLVGWVSLALFGLAYRAFPELARSPLALIHFGFSALGGMLFPFGLWLALSYQITAPALVGAFAWLAGAVAFLAGCLRLVFLAGTISSKAALPAK